MKGLTFHCYEHGQEETIIPKRNGIYYTPRCEVCENKMILDKTTQAEYEKEMK